MTSPTPPNLALSPTLPVLAFNFEQLKTWAAGVAEKYSDLIVTEDGVADAKRDMAEINKAKAAIDTARKEAVRQVSEPIRAFESQIKEVCGIFDAAYAKLADQVKGFEESRREEKRIEVEALVTKLIAASFSEGSGPEIPIDSRWLNKTVGLKQIESEVAFLIQRHIEEQQRQAALEQARHDRAEAIEIHVKALSQRFGFELPVARFLNNQALSDMARPLGEYLKGIDVAFDLEARRRQAQVEAAAVKPATSVAPPAEPVAEPTATPAPADPIVKPEIKAMSIVLEYSTANEAQVRAAIDALKSLCINFSTRYRQN